MPTWPNTNVDGSALLRTRPLDRCKIPSAVADVSRLGNADRVRLGLDSPGATRAMKPRGDAPPKPLTGTTDDEHHG